MSDTDRAYKQEEQLRTLSNEISELVISCPEAVRPMWMKFGKFVSIILSERRVIYLMERKVKNIEEIEQFHEKILFGDREQGHPGLTQQLNSLVAITEESKKVSERNRSLLYKVLASVITAIIIGLLKWKFPNLP